MDPLTALSLLVVAALIATSRSVYHLFGPDISGSDSFGHLVQIRAFRRNGFRIPEKIPQSIYDMSFANPYLLPLTVAVLPRRWWEAVSKLFSGVMDLLFVAVLVGVYAIDLLTPHQLVLAALVFLLTPQLMRRDLSHGKSISARKPGTVLTTLSLLSFSLWVLHGELWFLLLAVALGALVPITSRFSVQAYLFLCAGIGLLVDPLALALFPAAMVVGIVVSGGFAWTILRSHVRFMYDYAVRKQYVRLYDGWKSLDTLRSLLAVRRPRDLLEPVYESVLLLGLLNNPYVVAALAAIAFGAGTGTETGVPWVFVVWTLSSVVAFLVTSIYHLRFLGQPSRYLEFGLLPGSIVIARSYTELSTAYRAIIWASLAVGLATIVGYVWIHLQLYEPETDEAFDEVIEFLDTKDPAVVVTQHRAHGAEIAWKTDHRVSDYLGNRFTSKASRVQFQRLYPGRADYVTEDIEWLRAEFGPDVVLFDTNCDFRDGELQPPDATPLFENDRYEIYEFDAFE